VTIRSRVSPSLLACATLVALLLLLPHSDGGRTSFARAMTAAGVFCAISLLVISREGAAFLRILPRRALALVGLLILASYLASIFKEYSLREGLGVFTVIGAAVLAAHVARSGYRESLLLALQASAIIVSLLGLPAYLTAPDGSQAASALSGAFHYPNGLAAFLLLALFLPFPSLLHTQARGRSAGALLLAAALWAALILTYSRGGWIAALIGLVGWVLVEWRLLLARRVRLSLAAALTLILVLGASRWSATEIGSHLVSARGAAAARSEDPSIRWRQEIYAWTIDMVRDRPWIGTGIGTFPIAIKRYQRAPYITGLYAHNHYLQVAAEMGLPGLLGLLGLLVVLFRRAWQLLAAGTPGRADRSLLAALTAGLLASSLHAAVDFGWSYPAVALAFGVEAAILLNLSGHPVAATRQAGPSSGPSPAARTALLLACLAFATVAGASYYAEVLRNLGTRALEAGELERAIRAFRWATRLNPFFYSPRQRLAMAYAAQGDAEQSRRAAEAAFRLDPFDGDAHYELGRVLWRAGLADRAESAFRSAAALQPYTRLSVYHDLAELLLAAGRPAEALAWLTRGAEIFRPQIVTSRVNRCLAPGDRYVLARMQARAAEIWRHAGRIAEARRAEQTASELARPFTEEICFRGMRGPLASPESAIVTYWASRSRRDWPAVTATFASAAGHRLIGESLTALPEEVQGIEVARIASLDGHEERANVGYELTLQYRGGGSKRVAFTDTLVVERGGWRFLDRRLGLW